LASSHFLHSKRAAESPVKGEKEKRGEGALKRGGTEVWRRRFCTCACPLSKLTTASSHQQLLLRTLCTI